MARRRAAGPTELELAILHVLWEAGPSTARAVRDALEKSGRPLAATSVLTVLAIMRRKGTITRRKASRAEGGWHLYIARAQRNDTQRSMLRDLVDRLFGGSRKAAVLALLDTDELDDRELARLRRMLQSTDTSREEGT